jgi:hypothetical protein
MDGSKQPHLPARHPDVSTCRNAGSFLPENLMTKLFATIGFASALIIVVSYAQDSAGTTQHRPHPQQQDDSTSLEVPK